MVNRRHGKDFPERLVGQSHSAIQPPFELLFTDFLRHVIVTTGSKSISNLQDLSSMTLAYNYAESLLHGKAALIQHRHSSIPS